MQLRLRISSFYYLPDDQKSQERNDVEDNIENLEHSQKSIENYGEVLFSDGEEYTLGPIHHTGGDHEHSRPKNKEPSIYDCAPHKKIGECLKIHIVLLTVRINVETPRSRHQSP